MAELKPPVLVVGATRSGTSMLVRLLGSAPGTCFWYEPNTVWRIGHAYRRHDAATAQDAKPWVVRRIRRLFLRYQQDHGGARVIEKSPMNVLRVPFVHAVFPESKIIHIYRDGRANLRSQLEQYETFESYTIAQAETRQHLWNRLHETPWWEWPAYLPRAVGGVIRRYVAHKPVQWFGLRYPGWKRDLRNLSLTQVAAKQWVVAVEGALRDLEQLPPDAWMNIRYEELVANPVEFFARITAFCEIPTDRAYLQMIEQRVQKQSVSRWEEELDPTILKQAMPIMQPLLTRLGYTAATQESNARRSGV